MSEKYLTGPVFGPCDGAIGQPGWVLKGKRKFYELLKREEKKGKINKERVQSLIKTHDLMDIFYVPAWRNSIPW